MREEIVEPATRILIERAEKARAAYWLEVESIAAKNAEEDRIGRMIVPDALLYRNWRTEFDHAPYLLRWLGTSQGHEFMRKHGVDDLAGRAGLALLIQRSGTLPNLSGGVRSTALREAALAEFESPQTGQRRAAPADLDARRRIAAAVMEAQIRPEQVGA